MSEERVGCRPGDVTIRLDGIRRDGQRVSCGKTVVGVDTLRDPKWALVSTFTEMLAEWGPVFSKREANPVTPEVSARVKAAT